MEMEVHEEMERSREDLQALKNDLETLRTDLSRLLSTLRDVARERMASAKRSFLESTRGMEEQAETQLNTTYETMCERGQRARARAVERIEERPLTMVAGAFAAGMLFASLMRRH